MPVRGVVRAADAVGVALAGSDTGQVAVPVERRALAERVAILAPGVVEEAELDAVGVLREEREVGPVPVPRRAERERPARPQRAHQPRSSTVLCSKSATSVARPR